MKKDLFFVLDQGTTAHKLAVFGRRGEPLDVFESPAPVAVPHADGLSCDAEELGTVSDALIATALTKYGPRLFAFGFANQGETVVAWDKETGMPLSRAVSWQCQCAQKLLDEKRDHFRLIRETSGLVPSPYFSAAKLQQLIRSNAAVSDAARSDRLALGTLDAWMIWRWSGGKKFVTDPTTACRTQLYDTYQGRWSDELIAVFGLRRGFLPEVVSNHQFEIVCTRGPFEDCPLPLIANLCDQPAALIGHGGLSCDSLKVTLGTGAFVDLSSRETPPASEKLLTSVLYRNGAGTAYYLEGGVLSFASAIDSVCREYGTSLHEALPLAATDHGIRVLPAFAGLGAPHFLSDIGTAMTGVKSSHSAAHVLAATLQGLCFRIREILDEMGKVRALPKTLKIDGGLSRSVLLMQLLADVTGKTVHASDHPHVTAEGVALTILAKIGEAPPSRRDNAETFLPARSVFEKAYGEWKNFVAETLNRRPKP